MRSGYKLSCHFQYSIDAEKGTGERESLSQTPAAEEFLTLPRHERLARVSHIFGKVRPRDSDDITYYSKDEAGITNLLLIF